jgi:HSP20 family molecular chaperone IbpA
VFLPAAGAYQSLVWQPAVDIYRTRTGWVAKFDLAGVRLEDIHLETHGPRLSLQGVRRDWLLQEGCHYHSLEIAYSPFERSIQFPADLTDATISTDYQAGMLLVRIEMEGTER